MKAKYVYVLHGYALVGVYTTYEAAKRVRDKYATGCVISRERVRVRPL